MLTLTSLYKHYYDKHLHISLSIFKLKNLYNVLNVRNTNIDIIKTQ
jgi:hypothetical protein